MRTSERTMSVWPTKSCVSFILLEMCWFLATHWGEAPRPGLESEVNLARNLRSMVVGLAVAGSYKRARTCLIDST
jgi:hypothetical protein